MKSRVSLCALVFGWVAVAGAQEVPQEADESPFAAFEALAEGATHVGGFLEAYRKGDKLYLAITPDQLGRDFLVDYRVAQGIGARGVFGGTTTSYFEMDLVAIEKHGERVFLVKRPHRFGAGGDPRAQQAVDITFGSSVVESAAIEATRPDSAVVFDATDWFVGDMSGIGDLMRDVASTQPGQPGGASFDASRSYVEEVKGFERNTNVRAKLTFRANEAVSLPSVPDGRYIPVTMHYTLAALPEVPMERRLGDDRVGNFLTVHKDFSDEDETFFRRYVNRWRLEPGEQVGDKYRPVEPITYYVGPTVPDEYRQAFHEGVEAWNVAFESAGWIDAIRALDLPEGADADDIRYPTLRWNTSDEAPYGAIGPSKVDPRTGEILDADILFEANFILGFKNGWRWLGAPTSAGAAFEAALGVGENGWAAGESAAVELPGFAQALSAQGVLAGALLAARREIAPGEPLPEGLLAQFMKWVVMHEVGHSLGLQHNFRASASTPLNRLHDTEWTARNGVWNSVMEYPAINLSPDGETGHYYNPGVGSYDRWAIEFAYTEKQEDADRVARRVAERGNMFGNESGGPGALDPTINIYDLGADPIGWGAERSALILELLPELPEVLLEDNAPFFDVTQAYTALMGQYAQALTPSVKYIGGAYMNRDHVGDGRLPFENPGKDRQEEALELLISRLFRPGALDLPADVFQRLGSNGWGHFGTSRTFGERFDYPFLSEALSLQTAVLNQLLAPARLARIHDFERRFGEDEVLTMPELFGTLTSAIWSDLDDHVIGSNRRDLQRAHLDAVTGILLAPREGMPADARAVARWELSHLLERIESVETSEPYTRAHLAESIARIEMALGAGLQVDASGS